jgi:hypothetical protein
VTAPDLLPLPPERAAHPEAADLNWKLIVAFGAWSVFVWSTRVVNIWRDLLLTTDERVWLSVMALVFVVLGIATLVIGVGLRRWSPTRGDLITVGMLGGWTVGIWVVRTFDIVIGGDHAIPFVVVHVVLAVVSIALAGLSWRELASSRHVPDADAAPERTAGTAPESTAGTAPEPSGSVPLEAPQ